MNCHLQISKIFPLQLAIIWNIMILSVPTCFLLPSFTFFAVFQSPRWQTDVFFFFWITCPIIQAGPLQSLPNCNSETFFLPLGNSACSRLLILVITSRVLSLKGQCQDVQWFLGLFLRKRKLQLLAQVSWISDLTAWSAAGIARPNAGCTQ